MIALLRQVADPGDGEGAQWAGCACTCVANRRHGRARLFLQAERRVGVPVACCATRAARRRRPSSTRTATTSASARPLDLDACWTGSEPMGLLGILLGLGLLVWLRLPRLERAAAGAGRGAGRRRRSPASRCWRTGPRPSWAARRGFLAQFFPLFLLGALFGKLMEDSGSVTAIADFMTEQARRAARDAGRGAGRRARHLWRRQPVRRLLRARRRWRRRCSARPTSRAG